MGGGVGSGLGFYIYIFFLGGINNFIITIIIIIIIILIINVLIQRSAGRNVAVGWKFMVQWVNGSNPHQLFLVRPVLVNWYNKDCST